MKSDMGTQLSPNVSPRKAHRVLVPMSVLCLGGTVSYAILVVMVISNLLFPDGFFDFVLTIDSSLTGRLADFPDRVPQDQQDKDGAKHQAGKADSERK
jgi:hypothetical protein